MACVGAISARGKEHFAYRVKSFDGAAFLKLMISLNRAMRGRKYFVQMDNCRIHSTKDVKAWAAHAGVPLVFGVPYVPHYQGIENFWSGTKRAFRTIGTKTLIAGRYRNM